MQESCYWISNWSGRHTWRTKENDSVSKKWRLGSPRKGGPSALHLWSLGCFLDKSPQNNLGAQVTLLKKKKKKSPRRMQRLSLFPTPWKAEKQRPVRASEKLWNRAHAPSTPEHREPSNPTEPGMLAGPTPPRPFPPLRCEISAEDKCQLVRLIPGNSVHPNICMYSFSRKV